MEPRSLVPVAIILGGAFIVASLYGSSRFELAPGPGGVFRIDRLTGAVTYCNPAACILVPTATRVPAAAPVPRAPGTGT
jgi:hypothetical protein